MGEHKAILVSRGRVSESKNRCIEEHFYMHKIIDNLLNYYLVLSFSSIFSFHFMVEHISSSFSVDIVIYMCVCLSIGKRKGYIVWKMVWYSKSLSDRIFVQCRCQSICFFLRLLLLLFDWKFWSCSFTIFLSNIFGRILTTASTIACFLIYIMYIYVLIWWMCMCAFWPLHKSIKHSPNAFQMFNKNL